LRDGTDAALALSPDPAATLLSALARGDQRALSDYLSEEVLRRLSPPVRDFLLETSILERLCGPLCDAVTACAAGHSEDLLDRLERAQLFLTALDAERRWYRYHPLFAAFLRTRLRVHKHGAQNAAVLHERAARWLAARGQLEEAVGHALIVCRGGDPSLATQFIEEHGPALYRRGETTTVLSWLDVLPAEVVRQRPQLALLHAQALLATSHTAEAEPLVAAAERALACHCQEAPPVSGARHVCDAAHGQLDCQRLRGEVLAARATIAASRDDYASASAGYERALTLIPAANTIARASIASDLSAMMAFSGQFRQATAAQRKALDAYQLSGDRVGMLESLWCLGTLLYSQAALPAAARAFQGAIELARAGDGGRGDERLSGALLPAGAAPYHFLARVYYEWDRHADAAPLNEIGMQLNLRNADAGLDVRILWLLGRLRRAAGDDDGVRECMRSAERLQRAPGIRRTVTRLAGAVAARLALALGDIETTDVWAREIGLGMEAALGSQDEFAHLTFLRLLLAQRRLDDAALFLERLEAAMALHAEWVDRQIELGMLRALVLQAQGDRSGALGVLRRVLTQAQPGGYVRVFLDEGAPMIALLAQLSREKQRPPRAAPVSPIYLAKLLAAARSTVTSVQDVNASPRSSLTPVPGLGTVDDQRAATHASLDLLSQREVEIVRRLAAGMSNAEIARDLVVEPSTVKWHVHNILDKLAVRNRAGAVARAQSLGLL
jgi:LuxR family maltose regulon positive regulatory protein